MDSEYDYNWNTPQQSKLRKKNRIYSTDDKYATVIYENQDGHSTTETTYKNII